VRDANFSGDGQRIVTTCFDRKARVFDAANGNLLLTLPHDHIIMYARFSPRGDTIVTAGDRAVRVWDARSGAPVTSPLEHRGMVSECSFSPDGSRVLVPSDDGAAHLYDARSGRKVVPPMQHQDRVMNATFSPDGTRIVTTSTDHTARVWDATSGKPLSPPLGLMGTVHQASFSPDGRRLVVAAENTCRIWPLQEDPDAPPQLIQLEAQLGMGLLQDADGAVRSLDRGEFVKLREQWTQVAPQHAKQCRFPDQNLWLLLQRR